MLHLCAHFNCGIHQHELLKEKLHVACVEYHVSYLQKKIRYSNGTFTHYKFLMYISWLNASRIITHNEISLTLLLTLGKTISRL